MVRKMGLASQDKKELGNIKHRQTKTCESKVGKTEWIVIALFYLFKINLLPGEEIACTYSPIIKLMNKMSWLRIDIIKMV